MSRHTLDTASAHAMTVVAPGNGAAFQWWALDGIVQLDSKPELPGGPPAWLRVQRNTDQLGGFVSIDGRSWTMVGQQVINFGSEVLIGLAVTCHHADPEDLCMNTAVFDSVTIA